jgi:hypothetical protein
VETLFSSAIFLYTEYGAMMVIQEIAFDPALLGIRFACDLKQCKGACCTMPGGFGAPLAAEEIEEIEKALPIVQKYLPDEHLRVIEEQGPVHRVFDGYATPCFNNRACVYVTYNGEIAECAFEKAYRAGEISWVKPLSCHLFPLRLENNALRRLRYEKIPECSAGRAMGQKREIPLLEFLKEPLVRVFGHQWYNELINEHRNVKTPGEVNTV